MKALVHKRPRALQDIEDIIAYIAADSHDAARQFRFRLEDTLNNLARFPNSGRSRDDLRTGIRSMPFGNHVIFYQLHPDGVDVVRVLHGARDIEQLLGDG